MRASLTQCLGAVAVAGALGLVITGITREVAHDRWENGEHFNSGSADPDDVTVAFNDEGGQQCVFDHGIASVPTFLKVAAPTGSKRIVSDKWVTLHIRATVTSHRAGRTTVTSAVADEPIRVGNSSGSWVHVPLDASLWRPGSTDCAITRWTMTPGAWLPNDD